MERRVVVSDIAIGAVQSSRLECGHAISNSRDAGGSIHDCTACDERLRPADYSMGRRTPEFTAETVPKALLNAHHATTWAELIVFEGAVLFTEDEPGWRTTAWEQNPVSIVPDRLHQIRPSPDARFAIQFYDAPQIDGTPSP